MSVSGCVTLTDMETSQDYTSDPVAVLNAQNNLGQSFISRQPRLNGITIWLTRIAPQSGGTLSPAANALSAKLFFAPGDSLPVYTTSVIIPVSATNLPINLSIPVQNNLAGQSFYLVLSNKNGTIQINGRNEDAYPDGNAFLNGNPVDADIAFRLTYDYGMTSLLEDLKNSAPFLWLVVPLLLVLWLPGRLLLDLSGLLPRFDFAEQTALAVGLSLALTPVFMLWSTILKVKWSARGLYFIAGFLLAIFIVRLVYSAITSKNKRSNAAISSAGDRSALSKDKSRLMTFYSAVLVLVFMVSLAVRLIMIRDLATPAWVDSVHHALITRLILNSGFYPATYLPYLNISPTSYHPGFHSIAAAFTWLSQLELTRSLLILGQVLNALSVFAVYLLAKTLTRSPSAGLFSAIIVAFLTPMPAYYTSWGRYTELTGLLLLPIIIVLAQMWLNRRSTRESIWIVALGAITAGGLFMIHYRVLAFMACLLLSYIIFHFVVRSRALQLKPARLFVFAGWVALLAIISVVPWFIPTVKYVLFPHLAPSSGSPVPLFQDFTWSYLTSAYGMQTLVLAGLGLLWGAFKGRRFTFVLSLWVILLFLIANLAALRLPGGGLINNSSVEIMLFIPVSILGGYFVDQLLVHWNSFIPPRWVLPSTGVVILLVGLTSYYGTRQLIPILRPSTILSRSTDLPALQWVDENVPKGETIVINPFAWGYGLYAGNDGGYWISPLAGRPTLPQPVLYGMGPDAAQITQLSQQIMSLSSTPDAFWEFLHSHQLHYIYIGARGGVIPPEKLAASGLFNLLYHHGGVWILGVKP